MQQTPVVAFSPVMQQTPVVAFSPVMQPSPVTAFYTPAMVAPLYRRGPFGALRPVRTAYFIPY